MAALFGRRCTNAADGRRFSALLMKDPQNENGVMFTQEVLSKCRLEFLRPAQRVSESSSRIALTDENNKPISFTVGFNLKAPGSRPIEWNPLTGQQTTAALATAAAFSRVPSHNALDNSNEFTSLLQTSEMAGASLSEQEKTVMMVRAMDNAQLLMEAGMTMHATGVSDDMMAFPTGASLTPALYKSVANGAMGKIDDLVRVMTFPDLLKEVGGESKLAKASMLEIAAEDPTLARLSRSTMAQESSNRTLNELLQTTEFLEDKESVKVRGDQGLMGALAPMLVQTIMNEVQDSALEYTRATSSFAVHEEVVKQVNRSVTRSLIRTMTWSLTESVAASVSGVILRNMLQPLTCEITSHLNKWLTLQVPHTVVATMTQSLQRRSSCDYYCYYCPGGGDVPSSRRSQPRLVPGTNQRQHSCTSSGTAAGHMSAVLLSQRRACIKAMDCKKLSCVPESPCAASTVCNEATAPRARADACEGRTRLARLMTRPYQSGEPL